MAVRRRRTAEESRELILNTAARRLREFGLEGLNITGVADDAGISHATLIHHFGSSEGMRTALADKMTEELVSDMLEALKQKVPTGELLNNLFQALKERGHAKLIAWRAVEGKGHPTDVGDMGRLFQDLLKTSAANLSTADAQEVRKVIFLVATSALGYGVTGRVLPELLGMSEEELHDYPGWLAARMTKPG